MAATNREPESLVPHRNVIPPIFRNDLLGLDAFLGEFLRQILGQTFAPQARVDVRFLALVGREFGGAKLDLGFHGAVTQIRRSAARRRERLSARRTSSTRW